MVNGTCWKPYRAIIEKYEGGPPPLRRQMISPAALTRARVLVLVHNQGLLPETSGSAAPGQAPDTTEGGRSTDRVESDTTTVTDR